MSRDSLRSKVFLLVGMIFDVELMYRRPLDFCVGKAAGTVVG